ncbi:AbrB/MazE/SpoVT family DNA-binding domain-containing protein [Ferrigenium sp. UT5]|uniref:AbrB/MazE/SpoVT family DNA-binding domain-containing protein n=1 Tax=Ferrigenium sp. UT5 TaxID=3242105 RepID=UPI003550A047
MQTVKLSTKGQFVIPNEIRKSHHLTEGTEFAISFVGNEIRLIPLPLFPVTTVDDAAGLLARHGVKKTDEQITRAKISKMLKARDAATRE